VKAVRNLFRDARAVDAVVVVGMTFLVFSAYLDAYAYVHVPSHVLALEDRLGQAGVAASWFAVTAFLLASCSGRSGSTIEFTAISTSSSAYTRR
jgi:hypothetical protein